MSTHERARTGDPFLDERLDEYDEWLGRRDLIAYSEYVAVTDDEACTHCGGCVDRCPFDARHWEDGRVVYDPATCYGCGLCVTICPAGATSMHRRHGQKEV